MKPTLGLDTVPLGIFCKIVVSCIFLFLLALALSLTSITGKTSAATGAVNSVNAVTFLS